MLRDVAKRIESMGIKISFSDELVEMLAREGMDEIYGARPLRREIQRRIEDTFASEMLEGKFTAGDTVKATLGSDGSPVFTKVGASAEESKEEKANTEQNSDAGGDAEKDK